MNLGGSEDWSRKRALTGSAAISLAIVALPAVIVLFARPANTLATALYVR